MSILGIGVDIVNNKRVKNMLKINNYLSLKKLVLDALENDI